MANAQETIQSVINKIEKMEWSTSMAEQYEKPYKYYNPAFDFYEANQKVFDQDGKQKTQWWVTRKCSIKEVESRLRNEVQDKIDFWQRTIHRRWIQNIKDYQLSTIDRALQLKKINKEYLTNEKQPIIRSNTDRVVSWLFTGTYATKVYSQSTKTKKKTDKI